MLNFVTANFPHTLSQGGLPQSMETPDVLYTSPHCRTWKVNTELSARPHPSASGTPHSFSGIRSVGSRSATPTRRRGGPVGAARRWDRRRHPTRRRTRLATGSPDPSSAPEPGAPLPVYRPLGPCASRAGANPSAPLSRWAFP